MVRTIRARLEQLFGTPEGALAAVLAVVASLVCAATPIMNTGAPAWGYAVIAAVLLGYRRLFEWVLATGGRRAGLLFAGHALMCGALVALHPLYGVYAFTGYIDSARALRGWWQGLGTLAMACVLSFSQVGGLVARWATWPVYLVFVVVNLTIASTMAAAESARRRKDAERLAAAERLLAAERENARLQARLAERSREAGILDERARLSREIHDTVAQGLVGIVRQLEAIPSGASEAEWGPRVGRATESARECLGEARRAVHALASPRLDDDDLPTALGRLVASWSAASGVSGEFVLDGSARPGPHDAALLRIAQEALANVARHADAGRVVVTLTYLEAPDDAVRLDIRDDGRGFDEHAVTAGHGLAGIRQRAAEAEGTCVIESMPGEGCTISVEVSMPTSATGTQPAVGDGAVVDGRRPDHPGPDGPASDRLGPDAPAPNGPAPDRLGQDAPVTGGPDANGLRESAGSGVAR